ncbi:monocarboxylate transporter 14-like [Saccostrea echinata]|uniref:monocarboxylate transporter 14-like n=1 Tax=Saccostrea echinata TaxID=191078 RepID=UPI002A7FB508|nr:monocarboxylate transporter 14-like [Saccostrea echinata]
MACRKVDNPWGLMIIASAFWIQFISFGVATSFGVYIVELLRHFDVGLPFISLIGSINIGLFLGAGPLASIMMRMMSYRKVCLLGALLSSTGLIALPFTMNMIFLLFFYGILTGIGYCLLYVPSHTMSGLYYDKHRSLATGVATAGSGFGGIVFPNLVQFLIDEFGWRGSLLIVAGINLNTFIFAALLRDSPLQRQQKAKEKMIKLKEIKRNDSSQIEREILLTEESTSDSSPQSQKPIAHEINGAKEKRESNGTGTNDLENENLLTNESSNENVKSNSILLVLLTLCRNVPFCIFVVNNILWNFGTVIPLILGPEYFTSVNFSQTEAATLISIFSGGSFVGCVLGGLIGNIPKINRLYLFISVNLAVGIVGLFIPLEITHTMFGLGIVGIIWGTMFGLLLGLLVVVTADLVGIQYLGDAMGFLMLANGIGCVAGPPIGGWIGEATDSPATAFYFSAVVIIVGGLLMLFIPLSERLQNQTKRDSDFSVEVTVPED